MEYFKSISETRILLDVLNKVENTSNADSQINTLLI